MAATSRAGRAISPAIGVPSRNWLSRSSVSAATEESRAGKSVIPLFIVTFLAAARDPRKVGLYSESNRLIVKHVSNGRKISFHPLSDTVIAVRRNRRTDCVLATLPDHSAQSRLDCHATAAFERPKGGAAVCTNFAHVAGAPADGDHCRRWPLLQPPRG